MSNNLQRVQAALRESEYPALLITSPTNRFYATGFHSSDGVAVITPDRALFATDFRYIEAARAEIQGFDVVMTDRQSKYTDIIGQFCADCGINALAFESQRLTYAEFEAFRENLTPELVPVGGFLEKLRLVKAPWELKRLRAAQEITERAFGEILKYIRESITELDLAAEIEYRMRRSGAAGASFDTIAASGPHSSMPHATPTARRLAPGDFITMDFGCISGGYSSDMTRTVALGYATDEMKKVYATVLRAQEAALAAARAGIVGADLHRVAAGVITAARYGEYFGHGLGHSLGIEVHDGPGASLSNPDPLPAGMVVTIEPGIYLPGRFGVRIEDFVVLEEGGCQNFTAAPKELIII